MRPEEQGGVAHGPDANAAPLVRDPLPQSGPLLAVSADKAELHQLVGPQQPLQFLQKGGGDAGLADPDVIRERLTEAAQVGTLGAREREFVHPPSVGGVRPAAKPRDLA
jgi:hypothetical protein